MKKALIADDNKDNICFLEVLLKSHGFRVIPAANGREALEKIRKDPPDVIISDILMPVMDGYSLCRQTKADPRLRRIPFIFYTATYTEPADKEFALSLGAALFLVKPADPDELMAGLREAMAGAGRTAATEEHPLGEEMEFFRQHNEALFKKLEKKMSDLEQANRKLRILEDRYRLTFENVTDIIMAVSPDLMVVNISPSVEKVLGYKQNELIGRSIIDLGSFMLAGATDDIIAGYHSVLDGMIITGWVKDVKAADGTIKNFEINTSPVTQAGRIIGVISVARDTTERREAEERLRESERKYRELYNFLPIPVFEMDLEGNMMSANQALYSLFGGSEEHLKDSRVWEAIAPQSMEAAKKQLEALTSGGQVMSIEYTLRRLDKSTFPAMVATSLIINDGKPKGVRGAIIDISALRKVEDGLRRTNSFLDSIIENIPISVFLKDAADLRFKRVNRETEKLFGLSREELLDRNDFDTFPRDQADSFTKMDRKVLEGKEVVDIPEESLLSREKGTRLLHTRKVPILNSIGEPEYLMGITEDITESKAAEEKLRQALDTLHKAVSTTVQTMASAVEARDPYTSGHQARVADLARSIGQEMRLPADSIEGIRLAASIHDIGKLSIPAEILSKPSKLSKLEISLIREHSQKGYEILKGVEAHWPLAEIIYQHHERMDGSGYPRGLKGQDILVEARIIGIADVVEAMASHRPYRPGLGIEAALNEIETNKGILYDPEASDACLKLFREKSYHLPGPA